MSRRTSVCRMALVALMAVMVEVATAHTVITYPGWRGNNLMNSGVTPVLNPNTTGVDVTSNGTLQYPFGMQFQYPCGGLPVSPPSNRSAWPVGGGAISVQPGIGPGFKSSFLYINIGIANSGDLAPANYSLSLTPPIALAGVNASTWPGQVCVPQVAMPAGVVFQVGDHATIQVVQVAATGEAVYSCVDVTLFANGDSKVANVNSQNCYNSSDIGIASIFTTTSLS